MTKEMEMNELLLKELLARGLCSKFHMARYSGETVDAMLEMADELGIRQLVEWKAKEIGYVNYLMMRLARR